MECKHNELNIKNIRGQREGGHGGGARAEEPEIYCEIRRGEEGGNESIRRGRSQMWSQVQCFPSASELWFIMKKFKGSGLNPKQK